MTYNPLAAIGYQDELSQLPTPPPAGSPEAVSQFQQDLNAIPEPTLMDVPQQYLPQEYTPSGYERFAEDYAAGQGGLQLGRPRTTGQGILLGLNAALAGRGNRVAQARASFQKNEEARAKAVDEQRKLATQANLTALGNYRGTITGAQVQRALGAAKYREEEPVRTAAADRQAKQDKLAQENADRQQRNLDRQTDLLQANTTDTLSQHFNSDPDIASYRTLSRGLAQAKVAAKQRSGPGDFALARIFIRSTNDPERQAIVRTADQEGVELSLGKIAQIMNIPARFVHGNSLDEDGRQLILKQMREGASAIKPQYDTAYAQYRQRALDIGKASGISVDPNVLLRDFATTDDFAKSADQSDDFAKANNGRP